MRRPANPSIASRVTRLVSQVVDPSTMSMRLDGWSSGSETTRLDQSRATHRPPRWSPPGRLACQGRQSGQTARTQVADV